MDGPLEFAAIEPLIQSMRLPPDMEIRMSPEADYFTRDAHGVMITFHGPDACGHPGAGRIVKTGHLIVIDADDRAHGRDWIVMKVYQGVREVVAPRTARVVHRGRRAPRRPASRWTVRMSGIVTV